MLFNSYEFIFGFLPISLLVFFLIGDRGHHRVAISWLVAASLFFYAWWNPVYVFLIILSILFNYGLGIVLSSNPESKPTKTRAVLLLGVATNLGLLGYFKYANFFVDSISKLTNTSWSLDNIILPLAISFFTFQQIAYLVDAYRGETKEYSFIHYCLFVTFFPQLIAGPIVHHREMLPQFTKPETYRFNHENLAVGTTIFTLGLFKKVVMADGVAVYATPIFTAASQGVELSFFEAWGGTLAYSLQLYFDFSGYSDMAVGLGRMFGLRLPINFHAPYKAVNIIEFWRRWHITLSRFLRDYLYIGLGGSRKGSFRRYVNLMVTMVLGGLWHGAGWTFVVWGALHGLYLAVNHAWHALRIRLGHNINYSTVSGRMTARIITLFAVSVAWVFFRADSIETAQRMLKTMVGFNGISLPDELEPHLRWLDQGLLANLGFSFDGMFPHDLADWYTGVPWIICLGLVALFAPTTYQFLRRYEPVLLSKGFSIYDTKFLLPGWRPHVIFALMTVILLVWSLLQMTSVSEFLYFQF